MRLDRNEEIQITCRTPVETGLALARQTDARAFLHPARNVDAEGALLLHQPGAVTRLAGVADDAPLSAAGWTSALDGKKALLRANLAGAGAGWALFRLGAPLCPAAIACLAGDGCRNLDLRLPAAERLLKRDFEIVAQILAAVLAPAAAAAGE